MRLHSFVAAAGLLAAVSPASAQTPAALEGFHVGVAGGTTWIADQTADADFNNIDNLVDVDIDHELGYQIAGQLGYRLQTNIRLEGEIAYSHNDAERTFSLGNSDLDIDQELSILSGTGGVFFDLWPVGRFVPYIGGGLGFAFVEVDSENDLGKVDQTVITAFAEGGLPIDITPELSISPSIRFSWYGTDEESDGALSNGVTVTENVLIAENLYNTQFRVALRYGF